MTWDTLRHAIKRITFPLLPSPLQLIVEERYYAGRIVANTLADEPELQMLPRFIRAGDTVADVGANLGVYTIEMSRLVGPVGRVFSFEPIPRTHSLLTRLVKRLAPHPNVTLIQSAVGAVGGRGDMHLPMERRLPNFYVATLLVNPGQETRTIPVTLVTLDSYRDQVKGPISFIKMDVEGAEAMVVRGARRVLSEDRPVILCEIGGPNPELERQLIEHGYQLHQAVGGSLRPSTSSAPISRSPNYFALPSEER